MMLSQIKTQQKQYRLAYMKSKDPIDQTKATLLTTLLGELDTKFKNDGSLSDDSVLEVIRKFVKNNKDTTALTTNGEAVEKLIIEHDLLMSFLPQQLTTAEVEQILRGFMTANPNDIMSMGTLMNHLKTNYKDLYDGKQAGAIAKLVLTA